MADYNPVNTAIPEEERSYFDGGYFAHIGISVLVYFVSIISLGIAYPWMCCWMHRWKAKHTVICGKRMYFNGTGIQLIGKYILWSFLRIITFGIYGLWMSISMKKWIAKHTHYVGEGDNNSYFDGGILGLLGTNILCLLVLMIPFVGPAWSKIIKLKWLTRHTVVDSRRLIFEGSVGGLFVRKLLWNFLTGITFGIFGLFRPVKVMRWETENKIDNEHTTQELIVRGEYRANIHTDAAAFKTFKVEDDMECVKAGVTDTISQDDLLALANNGIRSAQYAYVVKYAQQQYTQEPFSSLLKAAAEAEYAPAMCLYLQSHTVDDATRIALLQKAADKGQIWAVKAIMAVKAQEALAMKEDKNALPDLKSAVRYADLLRENHETMTETEAELVQKCEFAIRRIQSAQAPSAGGKVFAIILAVIIGIPVLAGIGVGVSKLIGNVSGYVTNRPVGDYEYNEDYDYTGSVDGEYDVIDPNAIGADSVQGANRILSIFGSIFGGEDSIGGNMMQGVVAQNPFDAYGPTAEKEIVETTPVTGENDFWTRFTARMNEEYCVLTKVDEASDGTVKYEITCNQYYWSSLHYLEIRQDASGVQKMTLSGLRIYEPDSPDPTLNESQWVYLVREIFRQLDLGTYEDITPYTADGVYTENYNGWIFSYENTGDSVSVTVTKN